MTRTRRLLLAAVVIVAAAGVAGGVVFAGRAALVEPSPAVMEAMDQLAAPSVVHPLADSVLLNGSRYERPGACSDARAAYLAPDAPVPPQATLTEAGSAIVVTQPWALSGIVFAEAQGRCRYEILDAPNVTITATGGPIPAGALFTRTVCAEPGATGDADESFVLVVEVPTDGGAHLLVLDEGEASWTAGSLSDIATLGDAVPPLPARATASGTMTDGFTATIDHADGSRTDLMGACTASIFELIAG